MNAVVRCAICAKEFPAAKRTNLSAHMRRSHPGAESKPFVPGNDHAEAFLMKTLEALSKEIETMRAGVEKMAEMEKELGRKTALYAALKNVAVDKGVIANPVPLPKEA